MRGPDQQQSSEPKGSSGPAEPDTAPGNDEGEKFPPVDTFDARAWNLDPLLIRGIAAVGWEKPTYIQQRAIGPLIAGKDTLAQSETGMGKTGAFAISVLHKLKDKDETQALVMAPVRELATQIYTVIMEISHYLFHDDAGMHKIHEPMLMVGGLNRRDMIDKLRVEAPCVAVGTPGRVFDMIENGWLRVNNAKMLILDECDQMVARGFKDQMYDIFQFLDPSIQVGCFSATVDKQTEQTMDKFLQNPIRILKPKEELNLEGLKQFWVSCKDENGELEPRQYKLEVLCDLYEQLMISQTMIFLNSKRTCDWLECELNKREHSVGIVHADLQREKRKEQMERFRRGETRVLICSNVLARGIDVKAVTIVVNFDMPPRRNEWQDDYKHRVGRTARMGSKGVAINFLQDEEDFNTQAELERHWSFKVNQLEDVAEIDQHLRS